MLQDKYSNRAQHFLKKADKVLAKRIIIKVDSLLKEPFPQNSKSIESKSFEKEKVFRVRVGDYRILYSVNYDKNRLMVVDIDKRESAYLKKK